MTPRPDESAVRLRMCARCGGGERSSPNTGFSLRMVDTPVFTKISLVRPVSPPRLNGHPGPREPQTPPSSHPRRGLDCASLPRPFQFTCSDIPAPSPATPISLHATFERSARPTGFLTRSFPLCHASSSACVRMPHLAVRPYCLAPSTPALLEIRSSTRLQLPSFLPPPLSRRIHRAPVPPRRSTYTPLLSLRARPLPPSFPYEEMLSHRARDPELR